MRKGTLKITQNGDCRFPFLALPLQCRKTAKETEQIYTDKLQRTMKKMTIYYGSTTGTCEALASMIARALGIGKEHVHNVVEMTKEDLESCDVLILGSSTWGCGDLQDDWYDGVEMLKQADLKGKQAALFACGDAESYGDTFCEAMTHLRDALSGSGCTFVGSVPAEGYDFTGSTAVEDGRFIGLALDDVNESDKSEKRIANWAKQILEETA